MRKHFFVTASIVLGLAACVLAQDAAQSSASAANVAGKWQITWQGFRGNEQKGTLELKQDGNNLTGTLDGPRGQSPITGTVDGSKVSFNVQIQGRRSFTIAYTGALSGDTMSGTFHMQAPQGGQAGEGQPGAEPGGQQGEAGGGMRGGRHREGSNENRTWTATRQSQSPSSPSSNKADQPQGNF